MIDTFTHHFSQISDPRQSAKITYPLFDVMFLTLEKSGKVSLEYRYYISSASLTQERFAQAVRRHWGIENQQHWMLDVTMKEDSCQIYKDNSAENLAVMRHSALNMLRNEKSEKKSVRRKQRKAHINTEYLELVLSTELKSVEKYK